MLSNKTRRRVKHWLPSSNISFTFLCIEGYYSYFKTITREAKGLTCLWTLVSWSRLFSKHDIFFDSSWLLMFFISIWSWYLICDCNFNQTSHSTFSWYVHLIILTAGRWNKTSSIACICRGLFLQGHSRVSAHILYVHPIRISISNNRIPMLKYSSYGQ